MTNILDQKPRRSWSESAKAFLNPKVLALLFLGFSAGVPILLVFSTLSIWLREAGVERATIGFFSWAALAYGFKFLWSPLIDKLPLPILARVLGQRRSWLLVAQISVILALSFMALTDPLHNLMAMALGAVFLAFGSATQDIVIDAYRIECADDDLQGIMSATYIAGYRLGMIVAGAGSLEIAGFLNVIDGYEYTAWKYTYLSMAAVMGVGIITTLLIAEPKPKTSPSQTLNKASDYGRFIALFVLTATMFIFVFTIWPGWAQAMSHVAGPGLASFLDTALRLMFATFTALAMGVVLVRFGMVKREIAIAAYVAPFADFFSRFGRTAILILLLIATFRIADIVMGVMANVFYVDMGFEKQEIGRITKGFGLAATICGGLIGGLVTVRYGIIKTLFLGGFLAAATNVLFAFMSTMGPEIFVLMGVIAADNLAGGIASAAFVAYLSSLTSHKFTATQYALFSSIMMLLPKLIAGYSGVVVDSLGYMQFFLGTAALGVIPLVMIVAIAKSSPPE
ncbi:MAG: MFS transporter [Magnetovibrio sp.]|nr:MFS transporter [Magnetovibrio sp.]